MRDVLLKSKIKMHNKDYLNEAAKALEAKLPDNHGFILLVMPFGESPDNRLTYVASIERKDAINCMKEFLIKCGAEEDWMKHIK